MQPPPSHSKEGRGDDKHGAKMMGIGGWWNIQRSDGSAKGDWDVGITIDIMEVAPQVDTIILLSGDGDFAILLDKVKDTFSVQTEAYGVPKLTAKALINSCSLFHPIDSDLLL